MDDQNRHRRGTEDEVRHASHDGTGHAPTTMSCHRDQIGLDDSNLVHDGVGGNSDPNGRRDVGSHETLRDATEVVLGFSNAFVRVWNDFTPLSNGTPAGVDTGGEPIWDHFAKMNVEVGGWEKIH